jgi:hypothetical protein
MRLWQMAVLTLGAAALLFITPPAHAQVWIGGGPVVVGPTWGVGPAWPVARARYVRPGRYYRGWYRAGWYGGVVRGPRGRVWVAGRRW